MSEVKPAFHGRVLLNTTPGFKPGDQAPEGYLAWHEWAEVQHKAGLRQVECPSCSLWRYPQQLSTVEKSWSATVLKGRRKVPERITFSAFLCLPCAEKFLAVERAGCGE